MKSKEERKALKGEVETVNKKLAELTEEELEQVTGGVNWHKFGRLILSNGGGSDPALAELVGAIMSQNWPVVEILAIQMIEIPIVAKCWLEAR